MIRVISGARGFGASPCALARDRVKCGQSSRRGGRVVEGARLLSESTAQVVAWVQIPPSPLESDEMVQ